ncbi:MAG: helix-turn-helix domain-containing protein [Terracidiphilus sp.]
MASADICARVGERVRELRKAKGWNQDGLAQHTGLGRTYISNVERGHKNPSLRSLQIFATCFKMSVSEFLNGV